MGDELVITAGDLAALVLPDYIGELHERRADLVMRSGMTINGVKTYDPDFVVGSVKLDSLKIGKREIELE